MAKECHDGTELPLREAIAKRLHELQCDRAHCDDHCLEDYEYEAADEILAMVALEKASTISNETKQSDGDPQTGKWYAAEDIDSLVRQLDVALNGLEGAAPQAMLCDIVGQVLQQRRKLDRPLLETVQAQGSVIDGDATYRAPWRAE